MASFIGTKTGIQCRSHHQKYENKYKYPHRIINEEKDRFDQEFYQFLKEGIPERKRNCSVKEDFSGQSDKNLPTEEVMTQDCACQTDFKGIDQILLFIDPENHQKMMQPVQLQYQPMTTQQFNPYWNMLPQMPQMSMMSWHPSFL